MNVNGEDYVLTEDNPLKNINSIIYPSPYIRICPTILIKNNKGEIVYREGIYEFYRDDNEFNVQTDYSIISANGTEKSGKLNRSSLHLYQDLLNRGFMEIENSPGVHNLHFTVKENDKYKTPKTKVTLTVEYNEDVKIGTIKVERQLSNSSEDQEIIKNNGIYSINKSEKLIFNQIDAQTNKYVVEGSLHFYYRKLDENYFWNICNEFDAKNGGYITETGVYMCALSYQNDSNNYSNALIEFYITVK